MLDAKPVKTPLATHFRLSVDLSPQAEKGDQYMSCVPYANAVGNIMYDIVCTRLNISHADLFCFTAVILSLSHLFLGVGSDESTARTEFNVLDFGAIGDGTTDDTEAFRKAWASICGAGSDTSTMIIPEHKTFFVKPITFNGPCNCGHVNFQIEGTIVAPDAPSTWDGLDPGQWLQFKYINGLTVEGPGVIDGRGYNWWKKSCRENPVQALKFFACNNLQVSNLTSVDSAQTHLVFLGCQWVGANNLTIMAPGDSPNTDGIHIHASQHVKVQNSNIGTGDDCISVGDHVYDIGIENINCGPGHGISVGSLGRGGTEASVEEVHVRYVYFQNTTNGARIKTWQGAKGYAKGIKFEYCIFNNVQNPIVIDQYYCDVRGKCKDEPAAVQVSNVSYANFQGTSQTPFAVSMNCSQAIPCTSIQFDTVNLTMATKEADTKAYCINAYGNTMGFIHPTLDCLRR
ncbi:probable polygalacturonase At1g80170 [Asparagus officinalis]|uniref:probable polygalacturonase At1g80170 n=1 Tax=Asparagus officinalis TaxID=4686 RepID=UPI00098E6D9F|nr:probable polygalacturonase At1g80170 [Asparagus officinalis]